MHCYCQSETQENTGAQQKFTNGSLLSKTNDDIRTFFDAQFAAVEAEIIILTAAPGAAGVVFIKDLTLFVLFLKTLFGGVVTLPIEADDAIGTEGGIRKDKDMQCVRAVMENVVRAAADDDAGALFGKMFDEIIFHDEELIGKGG